MVIEKSAMRSTILSLISKDSGAFIEISSKKPNNIPAKVVSKELSLNIVL